MFAGAAQGIRLALAAIHDQRVNPIPNLDCERADIIGRQLVSIHEPDLDNVDSQRPEPRSGSLECERRGGVPVRRNRIDHPRLDRDQGLGTRCRGAAEQQLNPNQPPLGASVILDGCGHGGGDIEQHEGVAQCQVSHGKIVQIGSSHVDQGNLGSFPPILSLENLCPDF
jgi:hypothetical protein